MITVAVNRFAFTRNLLRERWNDIQMETREDKKVAGRPSCVIDRSSGAEDMRARKSVSRPSPRYDDHRSLYHTI